MLCINIRKNRAKVLQILHICKYLGDFLMGKVKLCDYRQPWDHADSVYASDRAYTDIRRREGCLIIKQRRYDVDGKKSLKWRI